MHADAGSLATDDASAETAGAPSGQLSTDPACLDQTCMVLEQHGLATPDELHQLLTHGSAPLSGPRPWDPFEFLAALRVRDPDARPGEIERMGREAAQAMGQPLALIPFASRLPTPSAFYDVNKGLLDECTRLLTPVLYAEEAEVIGLGSINPVALKLAGEQIVRALGERTGTRPVITKVILHHDGWLSLCQKQFGL